MCGVVLLAGLNLIFSQVSRAGSDTIQVTTTSISSSTIYVDPHTHLVYHNVEYRPAPACYTGHYGLVVYPWGPVVYYPQPAVEKGFKAY